MIFIISIILLLLICYFILSMFYLAMNSPHSLGSDVLYKIIEYIVLSPIYILYALVLIIDFVGNIFLNINK